jgi:acetoin utilization deacetylase AcuC-like enzyme
VFGVHACYHSGVGRTQRFSCHVKQLCNLEALGVSTAITRFLSVLTIRTTDESSKVASIAAGANVWASSDVMDAYPNLAAMCAAPPHHARHKLRFKWQLVYVGVCVH